MAFPIAPPILPMLAKGASTLPDGDWWFEPKWDGFRTLVFRDGDELYLQSRDSKPMLRYFPELTAPLLAALPPRCVVDGEIVVATPAGLDFDALQQRIHPAASRIERLSRETPAAFVAFDLLATDVDLRDQPFAARRAALEATLRPAPPVHLSPATRDRAVAADWFVRFEGAGFDGVVAKGPNDPYQPDKRVMVKIKHERTVDCVVAGFRWHKDGAPLVGSLILGLYDAQGRLHQIGVTASFTKAARAALADTLAPLREGAMDTHPWAAWAAAAPDERRPGVQSRWSQGRDLAWEPLRIERVVEVAYNHADGGRFRHPAAFVRWRDDKAPPACTLDQLEVAPPAEIRDLLR